ncbi:hypothetical protein ABZ891_31160 [Streptomyces sp. NPDC047023]
MTSHAGGTVQAWRALGGTAEAVGRVRYRGGPLRIRQGRPL